MAGTTSRRRVPRASDDDAGSIRRALEAGSDRYLAKPFTLASFLASRRRMAGG